jgi:hypothetical protein
LGGEHANLSTEGVPRLGAKWGQQVGLCCPKTVIEAGEEFVALLGSDDTAGTPVGRIRPTLNQAGRFEIVEEVGHDRTVDPEVLSQCELAPDRALSGGRKHLVAPRPAGQVGYCGVGRLHIGPKDHAQAPTEVIGQRVLATRGVPDFISGASGVVHRLIIRACRIRVVGQILCRHDDLFTI